MEKYRAQFQDWIKQSDIILQKPLRKIRAWNKIARIFGYKIQYDLVHKKYMYKQDKKI